jgi:hypothetical protein
MRSALGSFPTGSVMRSHALRTGYPCVFWQCPTVGTQSPTPIGSASRTGRREPGKLGVERSWSTCGRRLGRLGDDAYVPKPSPAFDDGARTNRRGERLSIVEAPGPAARDHGADRAGDLPSLLLQLRRWGRDWRACRREFLRASQMPADASALPRTHPIRAEPGLTPAGGRPKKPDIEIAFEIRLDLLDPGSPHGRAEDGGRRHMTPPRPGRTRSDWLPDHADWPPVVTIGCGGSARCL